MLETLEKILNFITVKKAILIIIVIGCIVYFNSLANGFVWDDFDQLVSNPANQSLSNIGDFFSGSTFGSNSGLIGVYYRPLVTTVLAAIYMVVGDKASIYHFFQAAIHITNSIILFILFLNFFNRIRMKEDERDKEKEWEKFSGSQKVKYLRAHGSPPKSSEAPSTKTITLSLFLALIFLVHPINVEAVDYVSAIGDTMIMFLGLLGIYLMMRTRLQNFWNYAVIFVLFLLSLFSKESGVLFVVVAVIYVFLFLRKKFIPFLVTNSIAVAIYLFVRLTIGNLSGVANSPISQEDLFFRMLSLPKIIWYYIKTFLFPKELVIDQLWVVKKASLSDFIAPFLIVVTLIGFIIFFWFFLKRNRGYYSRIYLFFMCWFFLGLAMYSQAIPLDMTVADRWFYFPIVGLLGLIGLWIMSLFSFDSYLVRTEVNKKFVNAALVFCGVLITIGLSARTVVRTANFRDLITLYAHDSRIQPNPLLEKDLENQFSKDRKAAFGYLQKLAFESPSPTVFFDLGNLYESEGKIQEAGDYYFKAVSSAQKYYKTGETHNPNDERIYIRLAGLLLVSQNYKMANDILREGLSYFPESDTLLNESAISGGKLKQWDSAIEASTKAKSINSYDQTTLLIYQLVSEKQEVPLPIVSILLNKQLPTLLIGK